MSNKNEFAMLKTVLEWAPIIIFFVIFVRLRDETVSFMGQSYEGFIVATAVFIPLILISTGILWLVTGQLSRMQIVTAVLVVIFGGLSLWFNDPRFFKAKPTILYLLMAAILGGGLLMGRSYLKSVMGELLPMEEIGWMKLTRRITFFFILLAIANEVVWRSYSDLIWVNFKTFGLPAALFIFFIAQSPLLSRYGLEEEE